MKVLHVEIKSIFLAVLLLLFLCNYSRATSWEKVVGVGFGNPRNAYAWSMTTFRGKLFVGTLNTIGGAQIWYTDNGDASTWRRVGPRATRNLGIRCMYADGDQALYACTLNTSGAQILRTEDGETWTAVVKGGFGNPMNSSIRCMIRFGEYLYVGTGCHIAKIYRSKNGFKWEPVNTNPGFESTKVTNPHGFTPVVNNVMIGELAVFNGELYAFTWTKDADPRSTFWSLRNLNMQENYQKFGSFFLFPAPGAFEAWRSSDGINWEKVIGKDDPYGNGLGFCLHDPDNINNDMVTSVAVFKEKLYLGTEHDFGRTSIWRTSEGTQWEKVLDFYKIGEEFNFYVWRLITFKNKLFVGTANLGMSRNSEVTGAQIWASGSGNPGSFYNLVHNGMDGQSVIAVMIRIPKNYGIRSFAPFNGTLFIGTATMLDIPVWQVGDIDEGIRVGCEIWKMIP